MRHYRTSCGLLFVIAFIVCATSASDSVASPVSREEGITPLIRAVESEDYKLAQSLIVAGADLNAQTSWGRTALTDAIVRHNEQLVKLLCDHGTDLKAKVSHWEKPITNIAAGYGTLRTLKALIDYGADTSTCNKVGDTILHAAANRGQTEIVSFLIAADLAVDARTQSGYTPLMYASQHGSAATVKVLVDAGADVNALIVERDTGVSYSNAISAAAKHGHAEVVRMLLKAGAEVDLHTEHRGSALFLAAAGDAIGPKGDCPEVIAILLKAGADHVKEHNLSGYGKVSPAKAASIRKHKRSDNLLLKHRIR